MKDWEHEHFAGAEWVQLLISLLENFLSVAGALACVSHACGCAIV